MMFWNILKNDIARGIFKRKYLYIISTVVIAALVIIADMSLERKTGSHGYTGQVSVGDLFQVFYRGSRIIKPDNMAEFYISEQYLFMVLGIAFIVGNYCVRDFGSVGMQIIIRCGSIGKWFAGKVMWCFASALYMTALTDILIVIISVIHGYEPGLDVHMEVLRIYGYSENVTNVAAGYESGSSVAFIICHSTGADVFINDMFVCNSTFTYINRNDNNDIFRKCITGIQWSYVYEK